MKNFVIPKKKIIKILYVFCIVKKKKTVDSRGAKRNFGFYNQQESSTQSVNLLKKSSSTKNSMSKAVNESTKERTRKSLRKIDPTSEKKQ
jgi:hypothetical protein